MSNLTQRTPLTKRVLPTVAVATGLLFVGAPIAAAHVSVTPSTTVAGSYSVLTFATSHGCDGSPTTKLAVQIPAEFHSVTPQVSPNWTIEKVMTQLDQPVDNGHGGQITERVSEVVFTATTPLPDGYRDTVTLQVQLPEDADGKNLAFPTVQTCEQGETAWVQIPAAGQDPHDLDEPAPALTVTAAEGDGHASTGSAETSGETVTTETASNETAQAGSSNAVGWIGAVLGAAGLAAGGVALARTRKNA